MKLLRFIDRHAIVLAVLAPIVIMTAYFIAIQVYPFGNNTVLTVDMGQQYIDFYALYRRTLLGQPGSFFYSFTKDLGGDMLGVWAYYLMSPFNLLILLFPENRLDVAVAVMTLLKYGAAGGTMANYLSKHHVRSGWLIGFGTAYALSGWMLANQLNLMWLDAVVFLPLIALGIDHLIAGRHVFFYISWLTIAIISNYYMAYMICIFIIGYFGYRLFVMRPESWWRPVLRFSGGSILAGGLSAWILLPTLFQLTQSKGTYTVTKIHWKFEYDPLKLLGKLITGSFSFDQMPSGAANFFVGSVVLFGVLLYFTVREIHWSEKIAAALWTAFLILSVLYEPLDLFWHGMQFPVWYPYRFSFVITFWLIILAARGLRYLGDGMHITQLVLCTAALVAVCGWVFTHQDDYPYLSQWMILLTFLMGMGALVLLSVRNDRTPATAAVIGLFMLLDSSSNAVITLNQLSYISHHDYATYTAALQDGVTRLQKRIGTDARIGKTVLRTKNDAMQVGYLGTDQFNSMFEPAVPKFFGAIGQSAGDGFVAYTNGTMITDAVLGLDGWLAPRTDKPLTAFLPQVSVRPDLARYRRLGNGNQLALYQNPYAFGLGWVANRAILETKLAPSQPVGNQERLLAGLTGEPVMPYFDFQQLPAPKLNGVTWNNGIAVRKKIAKVHTVSYTFSVPTTDPVYLEVGANFTEGLVSIDQDGHTVSLYDTFRDPLLLNVTPAEPNADTTITFTLKKNSADFNGLGLYQLDAAATTATLNQLKATSWTLQNRGERSLKASVRVANNHELVMTSIPNAPGWQVMVDGRAVKPKTALGLLMAIPVGKGHHTITMRYTPPYWWLGVGISVGALALTALWWFLLPLGRHTATSKKRHRRKRGQKR